ncbi:hypothetical protein NDU88_001054 [Pleurodeles waltl]|uniref:Uncharacterized protein n=1 Tax=Pleurodeles waltl TaxID=8319 RepID=A0AAV7R942_PLEWA|nr:hypothetical protein NDU88_001054 [Pleurodeles waltl]
MKVQKGCLRVEELKILQRVVSTQKDCKQAWLAARIVVEDKGCCPSPGRTRRSRLGRGDRGGTQQHREATQKQAAEALEQAFKKSEHDGRLSNTKEGPMKPEVNSASWAVQDGVLGTWAVLRTKDHARRDERGPREPVKQKFGACDSRGKTPSTHRRFLRDFQCRVKADSPQRMHHQEAVEKAGRIRRYNVAGSLLATLLQFCRRPGAVSGRSLAEVEEGDAEELW